MTLEQRQLEIMRAVRHVEFSWPCASQTTLFELASSYLAVNKGLVVSPDEITRTLSALAEPTN